VRRGKRLMVFCNTMASCRAAEHHLRERALPTLCYHGDVPLEERKRALAEFGVDVGEGESQPLLVCTDLAARCVGMDTCMHAWGEESLERGWRFVRTAG
jgi:superfamily II DNA/RNA helicase